jgi:bacillithiol biosynthesis deacetylase BshB1
MPSFLVIAPHPDDAELGMGGTILKLKNAGHTVHIVDMTNGEPTPFGSPEIREREWTAAGKVLGVTRSNLGLPNRTVQHTIEARHKLASVIRAHKPVTLFVPYPTDAHPDHVAVTRIAEDARFDAKLTKCDTIAGDPWHPKRIIYYYCTHLRMNFNPTFAIDISDTYEQKIESVRCYASQFAGTSGHVPDMVGQITAYFGNRIGVQHAEPFFTHELLGLGGLDQLV